VSVVPGVRSFYRWKGEVDSGAEFLLIVKSSRDLFPALRAEMDKLHPYEVPELLALPVVAGAENYLNWLQANLRGAPE
ncbi:MAG: divalent-cation tolerance protein CutA, partial [Candidatus Solibacter sp.]|nr:divalent-cation tolerance protein CutA [Candidatus Solibacter sp.]